jgi:hypothetical protein
MAAGQVAGTWQPSISNRNILLYTFQEIFCDSDCDLDLSSDSEGIAWEENPLLTEDDV